MQIVFRCALYTGNYGNAHFSVVRCSDHLKLRQSTKLFCIYTFFFFFLPDKTIKLWKISERDKRPEGYNLKEEDGRYKDPNTITSLRVSPPVRRLFSETGIIPTVLGLPN